MSKDHGRREPSPRAQIGPLENVKGVIDNLIRQASVLIADLATVDGIRAPLVDVGDRLFFEIVRELEGRGVGRKILADMFGLALRSYQYKVQRLNEVSSTRRASLWESVLQFIRDQGAVTRGEVLRHFANENEALIRSVLRDQVESGLVSTSGRGLKAICRPSSDRPKPPAVDSELDEAWDVLVCDHVEAVIDSVGLEVGDRLEPPRDPDAVGFDTFCFEIWPGHPLEDRVLGLLRRARDELSQLREEVRAHAESNTRQTKGEAYRVTHYFGQTIRANGPEDEQGEAQ